MSQSSKKYVVAINEVNYDSYPYPESSFEYALFSTEEKAKDYLVEQAKAYEEPGVEVNIDEGRLFAEVIDQNASVSICTIEVVECIEDEHVVKRIEEESQESRTI